MFDLDWFVSVSESYKKLPELVSRQSHRARTFKEANRG